MLVPVSFVAGGVALVVTIYRRRWVSPVLFAATLGMLLVIYGGVVVIGMPVLSRAHPTAALASTLRPSLSDSDQVALYGLEKWRFSLRYYLERPVGRLENPDEVQKFLNRPGYVLMLDEDLARLRGEGMKLRSVAEQPAVTGTTGKGLRKQKWGALVVVTSDDTPRLTDQPRDQSR
jgi:hypothetical protein